MLWFSQRLHTSYPLFLTLSETEITHLFRLLGAILNIWFPLTRTLWRYIPSLFWLYTGQLFSSYSAEQPKVSGFPWLNPALPFLVSTTSRCGVPFHSCYGLLAFMLHSISCRMVIHGQNCLSHEISFFWLQENKEHRPCETAPSDGAAQPHTSGEAPMLSRILVLSLCLIPEPFLRELMVLENTF